jgi:hypothetical protein
MSDAPNATDTATTEPADEEKLPAWPSDDELALLSSERRRWIARTLAQLESRVAPKGWQEVCKRFGVAKGKPSTASPVFGCVRDCVLFDYRASGKTAFERYIESVVDTAEKFEQQCFVAALRHRVAFFVPGERKAAYGFEATDLLRSEKFVLAEPNLPELPDGYVYVARVLPYPWFWTTSSTARVLPKSVVDAFLAHLEKELGGEGDWRRDLTTVTPDAWASLILNAYVRSLYEEAKALEAVKSEAAKL